MLFRIIIWSIVLTMVLRFLARVVLPIFHITSMTQQKMKEMQKQMEEMQRTNTQPKKNTRQVEGDYIDYEEVK